MPALTRESFGRLLIQPAARKLIDAWLAPLNAAMAEWSIDTPQRQAAFLAQVLHESNELQRLTENLNYSAARLRQVWPNRFPTDSVALPYANHPEKLANKVYAGRLGNGDEASGDGWKYRGRGLIQMTGRSNYAACSIALGIDFIAAPDTLLEPLAAARSAAWFWESRGLNGLSDHQPGQEDDADFVRITKIINGGTIGMKQRVAYWTEAKAALGVMA